MPHVVDDHMWTAAGSPEELVPRVITALRKTGVAVFPGDPIRFTGGSGCLTRLIGGWFVGLGTLPKAGHVLIGKGEDGVTMVALHVEDALGYAPLMDAKFKQRFEQSFVPIVAAVREATAPTAP